MPKPEAYMANLKESSARLQLSITYVLSATTCKVCVTTPDKLLVS